MASNQVPERRVKAPGLRWPQHIVTSGSSKLPPSVPKPPTVGLVLTGGGSRAAYQVGVLRAIADLLPLSRNPFQVIVGTSAGAVAASVLAAGGDHWRSAVEGLEYVWTNLRSEHVFRVDAAKMVRGGLQWVLTLISGGLAMSPPKSLFDNTPLRELLAMHVDCRGIRRNIERGHLRALALCTTSYVSGHSVVFYDAMEGITDWNRAQRLGRRTKLTLEHLMASAAIPLLFPPVKLGGAYFGDGAMRQHNPLSPALHFGADRLLIIGVRAKRAAGIGTNLLHASMPTPGEIFGYMLDSLFTEQIYGDLEQVERINQLVQDAPSAAQNLRHVDMLMLAPSHDPREIVATHMADIPLGLRTLLRVIGGRNRSGHQLASYLTFESGYTHDLIKLGYRDAMNARSALVPFLTGEALPPAMIEKTSLAGSERGRPEVLSPSGTDCAAAV
jgi:NTE family protein